MGKRQRTLCRRGSRRGADSLDIPRLKLKLSFETAQTTDVSVGAQATTTNVLDLRLCHNPPRFAISALESMRVTTQRGRELDLNAFGRKPGQGLTECAPPQIPVSPANKPAGAHAGEGGGK